MPSPAVTGSPLPDRWVDKVRPPPGERLAATKTPKNSAPIALVGP